MFFYDSHLAKNVSDQEKDGLCGGCLYNPHPRYVPNRQQTYQYAPLCVLTSGPWHLRMKAPQNPEFSALCFLLPCDIMKVILLATHGHGCKGQDLGTLEANHGLVQFCGSLLVNVFKKDMPITYSK